MKQILFGAVIGIANIIPGVSGGTFALILGIYPELIRALGSYDGPFAKSLLLWVQQPRWKKLKTLILTENTFFLLRLFTGVLAAVFLLSQGLTYCLENHHCITYGFFWGLILFSIPIPYRLLTNKMSFAVLWLLVGIAVTLFISIQVDPSAKTLEKSLHYKLVLEGAQVDTTIQYAFSEYLTIFFMGVLAVSAMVLPGISGSFVLLLFGNYYPVISAISRLRHFYPEDVFYLGSFGLGCLVGLGVFVRIFNCVFSRYKDQTIFFLIGLMVGSLYALWPFKAYQMVNLYVKTQTGITQLEGFKLYGNHLTWWNGFGELIPVFCAFCAGGVVMLIFNRYEKKEQTL